MINDRSSDYYLGFIIIIIIVVVAILLFLTTIFTNNFVPTEIIRWETRAFGQNQFIRDVNWKKINNTTISL